MSLFGIIPDARSAISTDFKRTGDTILLAGETRNELGGTRLEKTLAANYPVCPTLRPASAMVLYQAVHKAAREGVLSSAHDLSDGGLAVAVFESCLGGGMGADVSLSEVYEDPVSAMFSETPARLLLSVRPRHEKRLMEILDGCTVSRLGAAISLPRARYTWGNRMLCELPLDEGGRAWKRW